MWVWHSEAPPKLWARMPGILAGLSAAGGWVPGGFQSPWLLSVNWVEVGFDKAGSQSVGK